MSVTLEHVGIRYRAGVEVLRDVTLRVGHGEFVAIVGPSGCGKSTLLGAIADLLDPADCDVGGRILIDDRDARGGARRDRDLGFVFQRDALLPWQTIAQNVEVGLIIRGVHEKERAERTRAMIQMAGLAGFEQYYPHQVSGGMRQRAALVRTLAYDPKTILMDEPFGALDAQNRMILQSELLRIWQLTPRTILFVTHDLAEAIILAQRVVVLSRRPGAIKGIYEIGLPYPRDAFEIRGSAEFARLETTVWQALRDEFRAEPVKAS
ncbi:MAG TPA: ABC transporter ATP-binding protein [Candidatus Limnocylindria bacterium]|jgi:NitT/TauT family transport system ATP-binding protein|nr:ABC transporter ATP-binding protein [Candidatus Limnocylindria bacterium]